MDDIHSASIHEAMDNLWFHHNILFFDPNGLGSSCSSTSTSLDLSKSAAAETKKGEPVHEEKIRLNLVIKQPLFQLQPPPMTRIGSSHHSPPTMRRRPERVRSYKSSSELDNFHREKLSPRMISLLPGLQRVVEGNGNGGEEKRVRRPYLSEAWLINRSNSLLLDLQMLPKSPEGTDMKKHLRFWARKVASLIHDQS